MEKSRTAYVSKNIIVSLGGQLITLLASFISRTIFIKTLGAEYLGVNGLFTNVLMILSFAELGIGNAIIYNLYKPISIDDKNKIQALMKFYKKAYQIIAGIIAIIGVAIIPLLPYIIKDKPNINENINLLYFLFLFNTVISYFFSYKKTIITASQRNYIVVVYHQIFLVIQIILQVIILLTTHNYLLFLIIQIICTFLNNYFISQKADKMFSYIKVKNENKLSTEEMKKIFTDVKALVVYKLGSVVLNGTDNIIISSIIGISAVGLTSNYLLVISAVSSIIGHVLSAFVASIGNLIAISNPKKKQEVFNQLFLISSFIYGICSIMLLLFLDTFIILWIGSEFTLTRLVIFSLILHFYVNGVHFASYTYRTTAGLFVQGRIAPVLATALNIVLSIIMGKCWGLCGVFFATSIARFFTTGIIDPYLIYKYIFRDSFKRYYIKYLLYFTIYLMLYIVVKVVLSFTKIQTWSSLIVIAFIVFMFLTFICILIISRMKPGRKLIVHMMNYILNLRD